MDISNAPAMSPSLAHRCSFGVNTSLAFPADCKMVALAPGRPSLGRSATSCVTLGELLKFLGLCFLICKIGMAVAPTSYGCHKE